MFIALGLVLSDETGILIDIMGLTLATVGLTLFVAYYIQRPPR
jgi:hypothetical protein